MSEPETRFKAGDEVMVRATVTSAFYDESRAMVLYNLKTVGETSDFLMPAICSDHVFPVPKD